jgi:DNA-binding transcriptional LysR family regulator
VRRLQEALRERHPGVQLELARVQPKPKLQAVLDGDLDAALMRSAPPTPGIAWVQLVSQRAVAVVAADHPLAGEASVRLAHRPPHAAAAGGHASHRGG